MHAVVKHRQIGELMTRAVLSVAPETAFKEIVELIERHHISAVPVTDIEGRVLGVVSEADLLLKEQRPDLEERHLIESGRRRQERRKAVAVTAADLMTAPAITIGPTAVVATAAAVMNERHVKRLPVVDVDGVLVGIVSRSDLLKVFLRADEEIRKEVLGDLAMRTLWLEPDALTVSVRAGVVILAGEVPRISDSRILARLALELDGVVGVVNQLDYRIDDSKPAPVVEPPRGMLPERLGGRFLG